MVIKCEAQWQEDAALKHAGCDAGIADRTEEDRIRRAQLFNDRFGEQLARGVIPPRTEVVFGGGVFEICQCRHRLKDFHCLGYDFGANAIAWNERDRVAISHARRLVTLTPEAPTGRNHEGHCSW